MGRKEKRTREEGAGGERKRDAFRDAQRTGTFWLIMFKAHITDALSAVYTKALRTGTF